MMFWIIIEAKRHEGGIMAQNLTLKLMEGQTKRAKLAGPFRGDSKSIDVVMLDGSERRTFDLEQLCCILIEGKPDPRSVNHGIRMEEIETMMDERYSVVIQNGKTNPTGFFGVPIDEQSPYRMIFFTHKGIKKRVEIRPVGKILEEKGLVSSRTIQTALDEQQHLRKRRVGEIIAADTHLEQEVIDKTIQNAMQNRQSRKEERVGDILIASGLVTQQQVVKALKSQKDNRKKKIGSLLIEKGYISEEQLLSALATKFRMKFVDFEEIEPSPEILESLSPDIIERFQVFPVEANEERIVVATSEPTNHSIVESLRFTTGRNIELAVAPSGQIAAAIENHYRASKAAVDDIIVEMADEEVVFEEEKEDPSFNEADSRVIRLVNSILIDAFKRGVSDIHFEPKMGQRPLQVRYRIDGECSIKHQISANYKKAVVSRLKILSNLDIAERRKPQSGKIILSFEKRKVEYRLEVTPTVGGQEDAVLRVLSSSKPLKLEQMGFSESNLSSFKDILLKPYGIILCVGPTGSGKTTCLHSALGCLNTPTRKIWTAEDPVEITQDGLRQVQVYPKIGLTFQGALRSFLRADPDIIMIGEMRDPETAKTAIEASLTGHLVFSTLHTNSAPETVVRLIEMGMDPFSFADAFLGILAQRLVRRLCDKCKEPYHPDEGAFEELVQMYDPHYYKSHGLPEYTDDLTLMRNVGCEACGKSGYSGRIALHELMVGADPVKEAIKKNTPLESLKSLALEEGMRSLKMDGIRKIFNGDTDLDQVLKVCL